MTNRETLLRLAERGKPRGTDELIARLEARLEGRPVVGADGAGSDGSRRADRPGARRRRLLRVVIAAAAVLLLLGGVALFGPILDDRQPTPPATSPEASTTTEETARVVEIDWAAAAVSSRPAPGFEPEVAPLRITVPSPGGWVRWVGGWAVTRLRAEPPYGAGMTFERPLALYADRCAWYSDGLVEIGPTVDDLVAAVVTHPQYGATNVRDITLSGFAGKEFEMLGVPDGLDTEVCSGGDYRPWAGRWLMGSSELNVVRVLDVGGERVVIRALFFPGTPEDTMAELFAMFDAISIEIQG